MVHYPINNYDVSLNIGNYVHFCDKLGDLPLDFYALPEDQEKAKSQFTQAKEMLEAYGHYFGAVSLSRGRIQVDRGAVFGHGAPERGDLRQPLHQWLPGTRLGRRWHQPHASTSSSSTRARMSGSATASRRPTASDMWIHEGWATYMEGLYVEYRWGTTTRIKYLNGLKPKIKNQRPIVTERGVNGDPPEDQYFKGALMLNTLRCVINDDNRVVAAAL